MGKITRVIKKQIGRETHSFMVEGDTFMDVMQTSAKLSFGDVKKCDCCDSDALVLGAHKAQGKYDYAYVRCLNCKATLNFGQQIEDTDIVYLKTKVDEMGKRIYDWTKYEASSAQ